MGRIDAIARALNSLKKVGIRTRTDSEEGDGFGQVQDHRQPEPEAAIGKDRDEIFGTLSGKNRPSEVWRQTASANEEYQQFLVQQALDAEREANAKHRKPRPNTVTAYTVNFCEGRGPVRRTRSVQPTDVDDPAATGASAIISTPSPSTAVPAVTPGTSGAAISPSSGTPAAILNSGDLIFSPRQEGGATGAGGAPPSRSVTVLAPLAHVPRAAGYSAESPTTEDAALLSGGFADAGSPAAISRPASAAGRGHLLHACSASNALAVTPCDILSGGGGGAAITSSAAGAAVASPLGHHHRSYSCAFTGTLEPPAPSSASGVTRLPSLHLQANSQTTSYVSGGCPSGGIASGGSCPRTASGAGVAPLSARPSRILAAAGVQNGAGHAAATVQGGTTPERAVACLSRQVTSGGLGHVHPRSSTVGYTGLHGAAKEAKEADGGAGPTRPAGPRLGDPGGAGRPLQPQPPPGPPGAAGGGGESAGIVGSTLSTRRRTSSFAPILVPSSPASPSGGGGAGSASGGFGVGTPSPSPSPPPQLPPGGQAARFSNDSVGSGPRPAALSAMPPPACRSRKCSQTGSVTFATGDGGGGGGICRLTGEGGDEDDGGQAAALAVEEGGGSSGGSGSRRATSGSNLDESIPLDIVDNAGRWFDAGDLSYCNPDCDEEVAQILDELAQAAQRDGSVSGSLSRQSTGRLHSAGSNAFMKALMTQPPPGLIPTNGSGGGAPSPRRCSRPTSDAVLTAAEGALPAIGGIGGTGRRGPIRRNASVGSDGRRVSGMSDVFLPRLTASSGYGSAGGTGGGGSSGGATPTSGSPLSSPAATRPGLRHAATQSAFSGGTVGVAAAGAAAGPDGGDFRPSDADGEVYRSAGGSVGGAPQGGAGGCSKYGGAQSHRRSSQLLIQAAGRRASTGLPPGVWASPSSSVSLAAQAGAHMQQHQQQQQQQQPL